MQTFINEARRDATARANHYYFDVATLHLYFTTDSIYDITQTMTQLLRRNGLRQPIWINELNAPPSNDPLNPWAAPLFVTELDQQAGFIVQATALGLAAGAERIGIYKLVDFPAYPEGFPAYGLIRADGTHRPAYDALKTVTTYFRDVRSARLWRTSSAEIVTLDRGSATTRIAWARRGVTTTITLPAVNTEATLISVAGVTATVTAKRGRYELTLPAALCNDPTYGCIIGGTPVIVVESQPAKPAKALHAPAQPAPQPVEDITYLIGIGVIIEVAAIVTVMRRIRVNRQRH